MKKNIFLSLLLVVNFNSFASQNRTMNRLEMNMYQQHAIVTLTGLALVLAPVSCCYAAYNSKNCKWENKNYDRINRKQRRQKRSFIGKDCSKRRGHFNSSLKK